MSRSDVSSTEQIPPPLPAPIKSSNETNHEKPNNKLSSLNHFRKLELDLSDISEELLGSVTTNGSDGSLAVRTSARVIHKLRMDSIPPPPPEKKEIPEPKPALSKTPSQPKPAIKVQWTNTERSMFFEALNEFGRDFEAIQNYINHKMKRKVATELNYKMIHHIRHLYYQFYQKASKYLKFSDDVKKLAQELYTLVNYGEMKRKLVSLNEKCFLKLRDLVYKGSVTIRWKGRNIKIKTPSCRALRRLNQLESSLEDIQLPPRVECILRPATMQAFGKVQNLAQNPRIRATLPLQRKLANFMQIIQTKWRSRNLQLCEKYILDQVQQSRQKVFPENLEKIEKEVDEFRMKETLLCFKPPKEAVIHRPMLQLNELLSSYNICLNSYEEKIGATVRGEGLNEEKIKEMIKLHSKRVRHDSEKNISPEMKKLKVEDAVASNLNQENDRKIDVCVVKNENGHENTQAPDTTTVPPVTIEFDMQVIDVKSESDTTSCVQVKQENKENLKDTHGQAEFVIKTPNEPSSSKIATNSKSSGNSAHPKVKKPRDTLNPRLVQKEIYKPLLTEETIKKIREGWSLKNAGDIAVGDLYLMFGSEGKLYLEYHWIDDDTICVEKKETNDIKDELVVKEETQKKEAQNMLGSRLKTLLTMSTLLDRNKPIVNCICGHICEKKIKLANDYQNEMGIFKQPAVPTRSIADMNYRTNFNIPKTKPSKWWRNRNQRPPKLLASHHNSDNKLNNGTTTTLKPDPTSNHCVRNLYQNQGESSTSTSTATNSTTVKKDVTPEDQLTNLIEEKIDKLKSKGSEPGTSSASGLASTSASSKPSTSRPVNYCENSRSSIKSLLECFNGFNRKDGSENEGDSLSSFSPVKLLGESFGELSDENIDNVSLSSFLGQLDSIYDFNRKKNAEDCNMSVTAESSIDYIAQFEDMHKA